MICFLNIFKLILFYFSMKFYREILYERKANQTKVCSRGRRFTRTKSLIKAILKRFGEKSFYQDKKFGLDEPLKEEDCFSDSSILE